ncbi:hypothetical protein C8J30_10172 [Rhodobacter viridis]|uniref:Uncharacterized protein n=1 Tax=Rhodobacter viridis TaxID=1054202 RepID=A0A318U287_9RHOB|nr:hypothetical protein [Rhodobacter viridis]PYF12692.1 hypothetical protein C8J30_10172 [Rhodobacter viridis]
MSRHEILPPELHLPDLRPDLRMDAATSSLPAMSQLERRTVLAFVERLLIAEGQPATFFTLLRQTDAQLAALIGAEAASASRPGPYGRFPPAPLCAEDLDGPPWRIPPALCARVGERISVALEFAYLVVMHPGDLRRESLLDLTTGGWSAEGIGELAEQIGAVASQTRTLAELQAAARTAPGRSRLH